jgi:tetratricopeptide (TPR) repeat protein
MADIPHKAAPYLATAGIAAVDAYASRDAIDLLTSALELDETVRGDVGIDLSRTYWCRLIGQAHYNQDDQLTAAQWYRKAIDASGLSPRFPIASLVPTILRAVIGPESFDRPHSAKHSDEDRQRFTHGLASGRELSIIYLWESATGKFALSAINMVRVARIVGPTSESGNAVAALAFLMSAAGLRKNSEKTAQQAVNMVESFGDLERSVAVRVLAGMVMVQNGSLEKSLPMFSSANEASGDLRTGLERHRCKYMYGDALTWMGRYHEAHQTFLESANLAHSAEPHAVGQATAMAALNLLRTGRPEQAIALLEGPDGVPNAVSSGVPASSIMSLGILAEARLAIGQEGSALAAADEAEAQATDRDDGTGFYSGLFGYASILRVRLQTGILGKARTDKKKTAVEEDLQRVGKLTRIAPVGRAINGLLNAMWEVHQGREKRAQRLLQGAIEAARKSKQPFELGASLVELAKLCSGSQREQYLQEASDVFERHDLALELAKASALRTH